MLGVCATHPCWGAEAALADQRVVFDNAEMVVLKT
jgi:hypothetical protein